jgi:hypothetical protein
MRPTVPAAAKCCKTFVFFHPCLENLPPVTNVTLRCAGTGIDLRHTAFPFLGTRILARLMF